MSTILRALKKLEQDTDADSGALADAIVRSAGSRNTRTVVARIVIVVMGIALIAAGGFLFTRKSATAPPQTNRGKTGNAMTTAEKTAAPVIQNHSPAAVPPATVIPKHFPPAETVNSAPAAPVPNTTAVATDLKPSAQKAPAPAPPPPAETLTPSPPPAAASPSDNVRMLSESAGLTLQAISWSADAAGRIAVINGQVCREGDQVDGYTVRKIDPDDVIVSNGTTTGKLAFK